MNYKEALKNRRRLRKEITPQEKILWNRLRNNGLGFKFKRQFSIGNYIADFYCYEHKLAIEIDGSQHMDNVSYDKERDEYFKSQGIKTLRFWNNEVNENLEGVLLKIQTSLPPPHL